MSVCLPRGYIRNHTRDLYQFFCMLSMSLAHFSSAMLTIVRIAYRREGVTGVHSVGEVQSTISMFLFVNQISREPLNGFALNFGLVPRSLGRILKSGSRVKGQGHQGQKRAVHSHHPRQRRNGMRLLQVTSCSSRRQHWGSLQRSQYSLARERLLPKNPAPLDPSSFAVRPCGPHHFRGPPQCCRRIGAYDWNVSLYWNVALRPKRLLQAYRCFS